MPRQPIAIAEAPLDAVPVAGVVSAEPDFEVELDVFSGPLGVLLHLIESRQLDVLTVPLAELADAYVAHLATNPVDPAHLAEFVAMAAQLILLKSRDLLPARSGRPSPRWPMSQTRRSCGGGWLSTVPCGTSPAAWPRWTWPLRCSGASRENRTWRQPRLRQCPSRG